MGKLKNLSFAHLVGFGTKAKAETEDDEKEKDTGERDHEDGNVKKSKKAEDEKDKGKMEDDTGENEEAEGSDMEPDDDEDDKKKSKKAKKAEVEDDEDTPEEDKDEEMRGNSPIAKARVREQQRCAAIFAHPSAAKNQELAANLAFKTRMPRAEALAVLAGTKTMASTLPDRSLRNPRIQPGASHGMTTKQAVDSSWDAAFKKTAVRR